MTVSMLLILTQRSMIILTTGLGSYIYGENDMIFWGNVGNNIKFGVHYKKRT